jgi:hypothetical protein
VLLKLFREVAQPLKLFFIEIWTKLLVRALMREALATFSAGKPFHVSGGSILCG